jgi:hypothetical protein
MMEGSKKHYVDNAAQFSSAGLIIRQKEPKAATAAEEHFLHSLDWARRQGALSWASHAMS